VDQPDLVVVPDAIAGAVPGPPVQRDEAAPVVRRVQLAPIFAISESDPNGERDSRSRGIRQAASIADLFEDAHGNLLAGGRL